MGGRGLTRLQGPKQGRTDPPTHTFLSLTVFGRLYSFPAVGIRGKGRRGESSSMGVSPPTPAGKTLTLVLDVGPCGDSPRPLTAWACLGCQSCFLPWCIRAASSDPRWESRVGAGLRGASRPSQSCAFSFLQRSQQLKHPAWLALAPRRFNSGLPMNIGVLFVPQQEAWVVERMGKFHRILEPVRSRFSPLLDSAGS